MSPLGDDSGDPGHRTPAAGVGRDDPADAGRSEASAPPSNGGGNGGAVDDDALAAVEAEVIEAVWETAEEEEVADAEVEVVEDVLTAVTRERDEYLDMVRRVQADFENYKKRTVRQQTDQLERASENLVAKLLPALDAFALTRTHLTDESNGSPEVKALLQAAGLVDDALAKEGLERIDDAGAAFDPTIHDAVEHAPAPGAGPTGPTADIAAGPVVADVLRPGYRWKGRVIRPAMVRVQG
jgi:molecular chaperone GrpE